MVRLCSGVLTRKATRPAGLPRWKRAFSQIAPGAVLVLYTDGVTEAQDEQAAVYGEERLLACVRAHLGQPAEGIRDAILADVAEFVGDAPQADDITLAIVVRNRTAGRATRQPPAPI